MTIDAEKCTAREATRLAARKWFEKKSVRLVLSVIGIVVMAVLMRNLLENSSRFSEVEFLIIETLIMSVMIMSTAVFISNIGKFTTRKFVISGVIITPILCVGYAIYYIFTSLDLADMPASIQEGIAYEVLRQLPCFITSLAISLIPALISTIRKRKA